MTEQINIRVEKKIIQEYEDLANQENLDSPALVKKIMLEGLQRERLDLSIKKYVLQEISLERAAEIARISVHEMMAVLSKLGILSNVSIEDFQKLI